jgi:hypothetical protein
VSYRYYGRAVVAPRVFRPPPTGTYFQYPTDPPTTFDPVDAIRNAMASSHTMTAVAEVIVDGVIESTLDIVGGSTTRDRTAAIRGRCTLNLFDVDGTLTPATAADLLAPGNCEIRLRRGVKTPLGDALKSLGTFVITKPDINHDGEAVTINVAGSDRSRVVSRNRWTDTVAFDASTNVADCIVAIIESRVQGLTYNVTSTGATLGTQVVLGVDTQNDPWKDASDIATAHGLEVYFDVDGIVVIRPVPDVTSVSPDWTYATGEGSMLLSVAKSLDDETSYDGVVVIGEPQNLPPVRAEAWDPRAKAHRPYFYKSQLVVTPEQARGTADALVKLVVGLTEKLTLNTMVNPLHLEGDVMHVVDAAPKVDALYLTDVVTKPLTYSGAMQLSVRERRVT